MKTLPLKWVYGENMNSNYCDDKCLKDINLSNDNFSLSVFDSDKAKVFSKAEEFFNLFLVTFFLSELCWEKSMVIYTNPQQRKKVKG